MASKHSADQTDPIEEKVTHTESDTSRGVDKGLGTSVSITEDETSHLSLARAAATINPERRIVIEKRLVRKIDCFLFPMLLAFYILNYIDRNALPNAKLAGLDTDLGLDPVQYATCLSILYVGYCLFQVPSNLMLSKSKPAFYLSGWMGIWGVVSACAAATHNYSQLVTVRFFLGIVEAPFFPGAVYLLSAWYTRKEMGMRCAILFGGNMLSNAFGSLIALGITQRMDGVRGLASWRWLFIIEGAITVAFAIFSLWALPNYPHNTRWLKGEEKIIAQWRLVEDAGGADDTSISMPMGFKLAVLDWKVWVLVVNHLLLTTGAGIVVFYPTVVGTLGFDREITYALIAPPYLLGFATSVWGCRHADKKQERTWHMVSTLCVTLVGLIILASSLNTGARYFSLFLITCFVYISFDCNLAWISNSIIRPAPKRAAAIALVNMISQLGNIIASYIYLTPQAPRYWTASLVEGIAIVLSIALTFWYRSALIKENKLLDEKEEAEMNESCLARTGIERFRYIY